MPRLDPKIKKNQNAFEDYYYSEENEDFEQNRELQEAVNATKKAVNAITRLFWNDKTQKSHISEDLIQKLEPIWESHIAPTLIREFGGNTTLYVIFYRGRKADEAVMEIWDPRHFDSKPSQVFMFAIAGMLESQGRSIAKKREQASVLTLDNWS